MEKNKEQVEVIEAELVEEKVVEESPKEEALAEVVEETPNEETSVEVIEEPVPEEVEVVEHEVDVTIEEETYVEYFKKIAFKQQLKPTIFFGVMVVLLSYFFRGENVEATTALLRGLMWGAIFVVISVGFSFLSMGRRAKSTYARSGLCGIVLHTSFSNLGIRQSIDDQSVLYKWSDIDFFVTSDVSIFGHMLKLRKIILMSKKNMSEEDVTKINSIIVEYLGEEKIKTL